MQAFKIDYKKMTAVMNRFLPIYQNMLNLSDQCGLSDDNFAIDSFRIIEFLLKEY